jgi:hypothetical protein
MRLSYRNVRGCAAWGTVVLILGALTFVLWPAHVYGPDDAPAPTEAEWALHRLWVLTRDGTDVEKALRLLPADQREVLSDSALIATTPSQHVPDGVGGIYQPWVWPPDHVYIGIEDPDTDYFSFINMQGVPSEEAPAGGRALLSTSRLGVGLLGGETPPGAMPADAPEAGPYLLVYALAHADKAMLEAAVAGQLARRDRRVNGWLARVLGAGVNVPHAKIPAVQPWEYEAFDREWQAYVLTADTAILNAAALRLESD